MPDPGDVSVRVIENGVLGAAGPYHSANEAADVMKPGDPNEIGVGALPISVVLTNPVTTPPMPLSKSGLLLPATNAPGVKSRTVPVSVVLAAKAVDANSVNAAARTSSE